MNLTVIPSIARLLSNFSIDLFCSVCHKEQSDSP
jgi:hypothetical protein